MTRRVIWTRTDQTATEFCKVSRKDGGWTMQGHLVLMASEPSWLHYEVDCAEDWTTRSARVVGEVDGRDVAVGISADAGRWLLNGMERSGVAGCVDVDLNFSPSTNLLPIKRLDLSIGDSQTVRAAWLRFPSFELEMLEQTYSRIGERTYAYSSPNFHGEIEVDDFGLPIDYAGVWERA